MTLTIDLDERTITLNLYEKALLDTALGNNYTWFKKKKILLREREREREVEGQVFEKSGAKRKTEME